LTPDAASYEAGGDKKGENDALASAVVGPGFSLALRWTLDYIGLKLLHFNPTADHPKLDFSDAVVTVAGFSASAVAAGTAAILAT